MWLSQKPLGQSHRTSTSYMLALWAPWVDVHRMLLVNENPPKALSSQYKAHCPVTNLYRTAPDLLRSYVGEGASQQVRAEVPLTNVVYRRWGSQPASSGWSSTDGTVELSRCPTKATTDPGSREVLKNCFRFISFLLGFSIWYLSKFKKKMQCNYIFFYRREGGV